MSRAHGGVGPALRGATTYRIAVGPQAGRKVFAIRGTQRQSAKRQADRWTSPHFSPG
jgi:hypothetical protein